jgi:hypothetical protein
MINVNKNKIKITNDPSIHSIQNMSGKELNSLTNVIVGNELCKKGVDRSIDKTSTLVQSTLFESMVVLLYGSFPNSGTIPAPTPFNPVWYVYLQNIFLYTYGYNCVDIYLLKFIWV